jgi:hypothetical protein
MHETCVPVPGHARGARAAAACMPRVRAAHAGGRRGEGGCRGPRRACRAAGRGRAQGRRAGHAGDRRGAGAALCCVRPRVARGALLRPARSAAHSRTAYAALRYYMGSLPLIVQPLQTCANLSPIDKRDSARSPSRRARPARYARAQAQRERAEAAAAQTAVAEGAAAGARAAAEAEAAERAAAWRAAEAARAAAEAAAAERVAAQAAREQARRRPRPLPGLAPPCRARVAAAAVRATAGYDLAI